MTGDKCKFVELDTSKKGFVSFCDNTKVEIMGKCQVLLEKKDGGHEVHYDVYYIPKLTSNILGIGQLLERGYKIHMEDCMLWLRDQESKLVAKVPMTKHRMFLLNLKNGGAKCLKSCVDDPS